MSNTSTSFEQWQSTAVEVLKIEFKSTLDKLTDSGMRKNAEKALINYAKACWNQMRASSDAEKDRAQVDVDHCASALKAYECIVSLESASLVVRVLGNLIGQFAKAAVNAAI